MRNLKTVCIMLAIAAIAAGASAAEVTGRLMLPKSAKAGATITATLVMTVPNEHHAYVPPMGKDGSPVVNVSLTPKSALKLIKVSYPAGETKVYPAFGDMPLHVYEGVVKIPVKVQLPKNAKGAYKVSLNLYSQICANSGSCFPPKTLTVSATVKIA